MGGVMAQQPLYQRITEDLRKRIELGALLESGHARTGRLRDQ